MGGKRSDALAALHMQDAAKEAIEIRQVGSAQCCNAAGLIGTQTRHSGGVSKSLELPLSDHFSQRRRQLPPDT
jgi:hypothetical protein